MAKGKAERLYAEKLKAIRPFSSKLKQIDLRKKLSPAEKGKITKAFAEFEALTVRPTKVYRPRKKSRLKLAQKFSGHESSIFDVAFIHTPDPSVKVDIKDDRIILRSKHVTEIDLSFNMKNLVNNPEKEIARVLALEPNAKQFVLRTGQYLYNGGLSRKSVPREAEFLMLKYGDKETNNFFGNWLFGVRAVKFTEKTEADKFRKEFIEKRKINKLIKQNQRRQRVRKYGSK